MLVICCVQLLILACMVSANMVMVALLSTEACFERYLINRLCAIGSKI